MGEHALLSASSSHRWINCPPSAWLCEEYEDGISGYAAEGTDAHTLCEYKLKTALNIKEQNPTANLIYFTKEMDDCADGYAAFILELIETAKQTCSDPQIFIEQRLDFSKYVKDGFGTGDCVIVADGTLHVVDYKHGRGVPVEAEDNPQMKLYALGALELFDCLYDIDTVSMTIYQPRRDNISAHLISKAELYRWADEILKPAAELAYSGGGDYQCGEWCRFCRAKHNCRKRAEVNMNIAQYDFIRPPRLEDDEIESILGKIDELISWSSDIKDYALKTAIGGKKWNGYKLVEGRSIRRYIDDNAVAEAVQKKGFNPYVKKLIGVTSMTDMLGKQLFDELLGNLVEKPPGRPTLVPEDDKRPEIHTAADDFTEMLKESYLFNDY